ncbi:MAG: GyrI-like domain-containing protein [bacterium]|nr:GyrI-like domain-containing protein [bacterium]
MNWRSRHEVILRPDRRQPHGGLYAVTACMLEGDPKGNVPEVWRALFEWVKASKYEWRRVHELERAYDPLAVEEDLVLDLCLPIEE